MTFQPAVSVIIPTFNRCHCLARAVDSVLSQAYSGDLDVIVVDDGSTDNSAEFIQTTYPQVKVLQQANQGVSAARNRGLKEASADWIALLDSDDEWLPNKLEHQFQRISESALKVCHTEEIWVRNGVRVNQMRKHQKCQGDIFEQCLELCAMSPSSIVIHRSVFDKVGGFNESFPACEDYDLWLRICAEHEVALVAQPCIVKYGGHSDQLSRQHWGMDRFRVQALEAILAQPLTAEKRSAATLVLSKKLHILQQGAVKHDNKELFEKCAESLAKLAH